MTFQYKWGDRVGVLVPVNGEILIRRGLIVKVREQMVMYGVVVGHDDLWSRIESVDSEGYGDSIVPWDDLDDFDKEKLSEPIHEWGFDIMVRPDQLEADDPEVLAAVEAELERLKRAGVSAESS